MYSLDEPSFVWKAKNTSEAAGNNSAFFLAVNIVKLIDALNPCHDTHAKTSAKVQRIIDMLQFGQKFELVGNKINVSGFFAFCSMLLSKLGQSAACKQASVFRQLHCFQVLWYGR